MKVYFESNFMLLGSRDIDSMEFEGQEISLKDLIETLSRNSTNTPEFFHRSGTELSPDWDIAVNGRSYGLYKGGLETILKDGDKVSIKLILLGGG